MKDDKRPEETRQTGFYWVNFRGEWVIAEYDPRGEQFQYWWLPGDSKNRNNIFTEIGPLITRDAPEAPTQEVPTKKEIFDKVSLKHNDLMSKEPDFEGAEEFTIQELHKDFERQYQENLRLVEERDKLKAELSRLKQGGWIPVEERLPELHQKVLVHRIGKPGPFSEGLYEVCCRGVEIEWISNGHAILFDPEFWMPLPSAPGQAKNGND